MSWQGLDYRKWAEPEWRDWIDEELKRRRSVFKSDPDEIVASYNRENTWALAYADRELLELVQNADDAGAGFSGPTEISVLLTRNCLLVANTGVPFGPEGLKSIILSDNSPKYLQGPRVTGHRGVGFRAVLGSANTIVILSGRLTVGFSMEHAVTWINRLSEEDVGVREKLALLKTAGLPVAAPRLSVPFYLDPASPVTAMSDETRTTLDDLRSRYDTVVCLVFDRPGVAYWKIMGQIGRLGPPVLMSLRHARKLVVKTPQGEVSSMIDRENGSVTFQLGAGVPQVWRPQFGHRVCVR